MEVEKINPIKCHVCGYPASSFHYGANACDACKVSIINRPVIFGDNYFGGFKSKMLSKHRKVKLLRHINNQWTL